jgi:hypothetical protein
MRFAFAFIFVFAAGITSYAQRSFTAGVVAGVNGCQIHGDFYSGFDQIGFVAGGFVQNNPEGNWQGQFGIQYSRKGSRHLVPRNQGGYRDFEIRLNYVEVPLLVRYNTKRVFFDLGLSGGVMFKARTWDANGETTPQDFKRWELAMIAGIGYNLSEVLFVELVTSNSIVPIKNFSVPFYYQRWLLNLFNRGMYNNLLGVTIGVRFGGGNE